MRKVFTPTRVGLMAIFIVYSTGIILRSLFDVNGYVSSDSAHYLQLAQNILNGNGLSTANYVDGMSTHFATWPVGYPLLIVVVSFISGLGVFWASKVVNIIFLALCFWIITMLFKQRAIIVALLFSISTFSNLFVYTWSEVPFLFGMLWLVCGLAGYIRTEKNKYVIHFFLASLFLFFMRYIGLIGGGIIGLLGFYYLFRREWKQMLVCWVTGSLSILLAGIYLCINYWYTGEFTGMERIPAPEAAGAFWHMLQDGILTEMDVFTNLNDGNIWWTFGLVCLALILFIRPKYVRALFHIPKTQLLIPGLFLLVGVVYFMAIVYMRWTSFFDALNFRLLGPATFMAALFLCGWLAQLDRQAWLAWRRVLVMIFGIGFLVNVIQPVYEAWEDEGPMYHETLHEVQKTYEKIPQQSIVAFENIHARYLRTDIQFIKVHFQPYFADAESIDTFCGRVTPNNATGVYFQEKELKTLKGYTFDESFEHMMEKGQGNDFAPFASCP